MSVAKKIKVCHLTSVHNALDTRIFFKECTSLAIEYDVYLVAPHDRKERLNGISIFPLKVYNNRLLRFLLTDLQLLLKALTVNARLYHFHDPELIPIGFLLRFLGKKIIYDVHEDVRADLKQKHWLPLKKLFLIVYNLFDKAAQKLFYIILAESSYTTHYSRSRYTLVQNFVQPELFAENKRKTATASDSLLLVGTLAGKRGLETLIKALAKLKKENISVKLICVGKKDRALKLLNTLPEYTLVKEQVIFMGHKPMSDAYKYAPDCYAGIALPEDLENHRESYPTKMFEYMACGLPVVASDFPMYKDVVEKHQCGLNVDPGDPIAVAEAIWHLCKDPERAYQMGQHGIAAVEAEYNWKSENDRLLGLYKEALQ